MCYMCIAHVFSFYCFNRRLGPRGTKFVCACVFRCVMVMCFGVPYRYLTFFKSLSLNQKRVISTPACMFELQ